MVIGRGWGCCPLNPQGKKRGQSLETFLEDFEGVSREQADAVLRLAMDGLLGRLKRS